MRHIVKPRNKCAFLTATHYRKLWGQYRLITSAKTALEEERSRTNRRMEKNGGGEFKICESISQKTHKIKSRLCKAELYFHDSITPVHKL